MTNSHSSGSGTGSVGMTSVLTGPLHIPGYHFKSATTPSLAHGENVDIVYGYRITNKSAVVAKVSTDSLRFEREFYIMKKLHQYKDGSSHIVRPLEYINMPSGLTVAIYADEGQGYLKQHLDDSIKSTSTSHSDGASSIGSDNSAGTFRSWVRSNRKKAYDMFDDEEHNNMPSYDLCTFLRFAIRCTDCLEFIHRHGVTHGEVRLSSFQWNGSDDSHVKMWNFGSGTKSLETYLTSEGWRKTAKSKELMGILQNLLTYMSPEQTGRTTYTPDHRSDIYSLGIVFFILLTGRNPFDGGPLEILNGILSRKITLVHELQLDVPEVLARIIEKMTNKTPDDRYTSAHGVRSDLKECLRRLLLTPGESTTEEIIPMFPLAEHDIASVFTLPKSIYGRQDILSEMTFIIERCAGLYKPFRLRSKSKNTSTPGTSTMDNNIPELLSDASGDTESNGDMVTHKSTTSPSRCSGGIDGSEVSSVNGRVIGGNSKATTTIVGVYGPGGIGKSTLFTAVQPTARQNGYVAVTKFDSRNKVPYSAVLRSLSQILQQILSESEEEITAFYEHIKISLGAQFCNVGLITPFVPELKPLLEDGVEEAIQSIQMDNIEARMRFHNLYVEIIRAITHWRMTTLFLDDLHQADEPSLEIMETLITSRVKILIFLSYRDEEVTDKLSELLENKVANVHFLPVAPMGQDPLVDFICDTLHRPRDVSREAVMPLVDIIYKKTQGNAFYTAQLLRTLERKKFIFFNWEKNEWDYDLREIEDAAIFEHGDFRPDAQLDVSFIVARLRELPPAGQALLKWASFVGDTFSWSTVKSLMLDGGKELSATPDDDILSVISDHHSSSGSSTTSEPIMKSYKSLYSPFSKDLGSKDTSSKSSSSHRSGSNDPMSGLQAVLQEGYIMPVSMDEFKWSHDRISQAAAELANPDTRGRIHLTIAQHMMKESVVDTFLVADHLLKCHDLLMTMDDRQAYRKVMIEAGDKGRSSGALGMAFAYYLSAIRLAKAGEEWSDDVEYEVNLKLYINAASLSWTVGENETTETFLKDIFDNARTPLDRLPAYAVQAKYHFSCQSHNKAREALLQGIGELSDEPSKIDTSDEGLQAVFNETERFMNEIGADGILELAPCQDRNLKELMSLMDEQIAVNYFSGQKRDMYYWSCRVFILSCQNGPTSATGSACVAAGLGFSIMCKKYALAERIGSLGVVLADKYGSSQDKGRARCLHMAFTAQWGSHLQENIPKLIRPGVQHALSAGDRIYGTALQAHTAICMLYCGHHIADTLRESEEIFQDIHAWSPTTEMCSFVMCVIRTCKALQGHTYIDTPKVFDGDDGFSDEHFMNESAQHNTNPEVAQNWYESYKMIPLTIYGHYEAAIETGYRCFESIDTHPNHRHTRLMLAYFSLALIEKARNDPENKKQCLDQIKINQEMLHEWAIHSRINYVMYYTFVEAELASLETDVLKAGQLYEEAISQAREGSWFLELCVIHEYAATFYDRIGFRNVAYGFIVKAAKMYMAHGSYGKVRHINAKFADLLSGLSDDRLERHDMGIQTDPIPFHSGGAWSTTSSSQENTGLGVSNEPYLNESIPPVTTEHTLMTLDILDMASILRSSQVMSSEVKFDGLLTSMINIILENSGADSGTIIVKDEKYGVAAYGSQQQSSATYDPPKPLSENDSLVSSRIINHTIHTSESIFIHDVEQDPRFAVGPWFERTGKKSVICMPITHKCTTVGCLLIEGSVGVFTQRHVTVLSLLCQQMGISITNAFLFKSVQRVTMANMRMIEMQKQALEEARKSKEAADKATRLREIFLANMSHEIRTPFSGFYGMISLLAETKLDAEQRDLVRTAKESCEMLLQLIDDLLNFSKLQAGKVSLDLSSVVIEDLVADVVEMLIAMAVQKRINITYIISEEVPAVVIADGNRLRQVIINLLGNAIKFTHEGEIVIRCSIDREKPIKDQVPLLFEVIDSGIGISKEQRKALFVPFSQVDGSTTRKYGGTGLGLSICLQLVELMSGNIDVSSEPSKGSRFFFTISATRQVDQSKQLMEGVQNRLKKLKNTRILVADKHESTITMVRQLLPGAAVDGVCSVDELQSHQATDYPIIIVGLFLTHDPNFEVWASKLKQFLERARCIVVMHYPTGALSELLGGRTSKDLVAIRDERSDEPVSTILSATGMQKKKQAIVRMPVPIRRNTLLKIIMEMLRKPEENEKLRNRLILSNRSRSEGQRLVDSLTPKERGLFSSQHILAAEDNPVARKLLHKQLTRLDFNVVCASNGLEAVEEWAKHPPGYFKMAFFDHHMPKCDGVEATRRIRKIEKDSKIAVRLPIVALTADIQDSAKEICMNAGMDEYLTKPMSHKLLADAIRKYCCDVLQ